MPGVTCSAPYGARHPAAGEVAVSSEGRDNHCPAQCFLFYLTIDHYQLIFLNSTLISVNQESLPRKRVLRSKEYKNSITLTDIQKDILIGTLLGDSSLEFGAVRSRSINARLRFLPGTLALAPQQTNFSCSCCIFNVYL
jgi:hypothetical protein